MAYVLVSAGTVATGTASVTPTFGASTTAGNLLIAWVIATGGSGSITASAGWSTPTSVTNASAQLFFKANCTAGESNPTFSKTSATAMAGCLAEFSGGATTSPQDAGTVSLSGGVVPKTGVLTGVQTAGNLLVAVVKYTLTKAGTDTTTHTSNNATYNDIANNDAASTVDHYRFSYGFLDTTAQTDTTVTDTSMNFSATNGHFVDFNLAPLAIYPKPLPRYGQAVRRASTY